jgi:hypothetical protein
MTALIQEGMNLKFALRDDGYGGDLFSQGYDAAQAAQEVAFQLPLQPVEMHTAATKQFTSALSSPGAAGEPNFAEYLGYASILFLTPALKAAAAAPLSRRS